MNIEFFRLPTESVDNLVDSLFKRGANAHVIYPFVKLIIFYTGQKIIKNQ